MRIFVAGGTGAVGRALVPRLIGRGHRVLASTRKAGRRAELRELGAEPVLLDALDREAVFRTLASIEPDAVVHELTALSQARSLRRFDAEFAVTNRLRTEGTDNLLGAARAAGAARFVAQSFTGWTNIRRGGPVKTERDPLDPQPPHTMRQTLEAIRHLERAVTESRGIEGVVLRYGYFYGPGTSFAPGGDIVEGVRRRRFPIVGAGTGVWSFVHMHDVATATAIATESGATGVYNIVDDEPAEVAAWLPELARVVGARPPRRLPVWLARMVVGDAGVAMMTECRGSSNVKAKETFGWRPAFATWRDGFRHDLSA